MNDTLRHKISVIIPCHNEEHIISDLVKALMGMSALDEILVINDGSTDQSGRLAEEAGARVIHHQTCKGNGAAVKSGLRHASFDWVIIIDADGQHQVEDVILLLQIPYDYDLVIGARTFRWNRFRDFGNLFLAFIASFLTKHDIKDLTSGLRRINRKLALNFWHLYPEGFSFPTTSTIMFITTGHSVTYLPINNLPRVSAQSKSKLRPFKDGVKFLSIIYRVILLSYPLRFFIPIGVALMMAGILWTIRNIYLRSQISAAGVLFLISGLVILLFGTIADQLSQIRKTMAKLN